MNAANVVQTIQLVIAPSVMLSSCFLCQNVALGRFMRISDRLHSLVRERIDVLDKYDSSNLAYIDALHLIDQELIQLSDRYYALQKAIICLYGASIFFLFTMLTIGLSMEFYPMVFSYLAIMLFLLGTFTLLIAVFIAMSEVSVSHRAVRAEVRWAMSLRPESQESK
ncbi:DUF2721 domain-containing protein [Alkalinema pantanalense CENA528]|uniref:DUF2721 domain-containing protein n=1 Tax=Alkalinema pantanalense TaxID=1620705 RepID=UPI003D6DC51C